MVMQGFDWQWDNENQKWSVFPHHDEAQEHADFLAGLNAKERVNVRDDG